MKKILFVLALLLSQPLLAQVTVTANAPDAAAGSLATANDAVMLGISGTRWATAKFAVTAAGTSTYTAEVSVDGGTNWIAAPYGKRTDAVSANPTVAAFAASNFGSTITWEFPLPANATHFRMRCANSGTASSITLSPGQVFVPGTPVVAVLYDQTSGTNSSLSTGTLDLSGWSALFASFNATGGVPSFTFSEIDDAGGASNLQITTPLTAVANFLTWSLGAAVGNINGGASVPAALPRRAAFSSAAVVAQTTRMRIEVRR